MRTLLVIVSVLAVLSSCKQDKAPAISDSEVLALPWDSIVAHAKGTTVHLSMWQGDPFINAYLQDYVVPQLEQLYDINLVISAGQGNEIVKMVMAEKEAGVKSGNMDMAWINGETFFQLREVNGLFGPFTDKLPNAQFVDFDNPFIGIDFQQKIDGYESPWGNVQLALIYDTLKTPNPPKDLGELSAFVQAHPGQFTIPYEFTGLTLLKSWLIALAGGDDALSGPFNEEAYMKYSAMLWDSINAMKPYFWKEGKTFPNSVANMHQMFANGEIAITISNNDGEVDNKVIQKLFPASSRSYVMRSGTIQNSHYMGILINAPNKPGAMVVANFLMSAEAQYEKMKPAVWGDGTILNLKTLSPEWQQKFATIPDRTYAPKRIDIQPYALMEIAPEYMIRMFDDFRTEVIEK